MNIYIYSPNYLSRGKIFSTPKFDLGHPIIRTTQIYSFEKKKNLNPSSQWCWQWQCRPNPTLRGHVWQPAGQIRPSGNLTWSVVARFGHTPTNMAATGQVRLSWDKYDRPLRYRQRRPDPTVPLKKKKFRHGRTCPMVARFSIALKKKW